VLLNSGYMEDPPISRWVFAFWGDALTNHWRGSGLVLSDQPFKACRRRSFTILRFRRFIRTLARLEKSLLSIC